MFIDLHTHSTCSDGSLSPAALAASGGRIGLSAMSLTDHDTTDGVEEFLSSCKNCNITGIAGVELSAKAPYTLHILGYGIDVLCKELQNRLREVRFHRDNRNILICEKLQENGISITIEELLEAGQSVIGRPHIAKLLMKKGYALDFKAAFVRYLGRGGCAYVPRVRLSPHECVNLILQSGGKPVLAHPAQTGLLPLELEALIIELKTWGLWGLECIHSCHSGDDIYKYLELAALYGLKPTAGSDFHGAIKPDVPLGVRVSSGLIPLEEFNLF